MSRTREEHLDWAKARAIEFLDNGDNRQALASIASDLNKHDETRNHPDIPKLGAMVFSANMGGLRSLIEGLT